MTFAFPLEAAQAGLSFTLLVAGALLVALVVTTLQTMRYLLSLVYILKLPMAGSLSHFINAWRVIFRDPWVLDVIEHGYSLQLEYRPHHVFTEQQKELCNKEVRVCYKGTIWREDVTLLVEYLWYLSPPVDGTPL